MMARVGPQAAEYLGHLLPADAEAAKAAQLRRMGSMYGEGRVEFRTKRSMLPARTGWKRLAASAKRHDAGGGEQNPSPQRQDQHRRMCSRQVDQRQEVNRQQYRRCWLIGGTLTSTIWRRGCGLDRQHWRQIGRVR